MGSGMRDDTPPQRATLCTGFPFAVEGWVGAAKSMMVDGYQEALKAGDPAKQREYARQYMAAIEAGQIGGEDETDPDLVRFRQSGEENLHFGGWIELDPRGRREFRCTTTRKPWYVYAAETLGFPTKVVGIPAFEDLPDSVALDTVRPCTSLGARVPITDDPGGEEILSYAPDSECLEQAMIKAGKSA